MHTDYNLMKKWASRSGCSVLKAKATHHKQVPEDAPSSAFAIVIPKDNPPAQCESFFVGFSITLNSDTTINIQAGEYRQYHKTCQSLRKKGWRTMYSLTSGNKYYLYQGFIRMNLGIDGLYRLSAARCNSSLQYRVTPSSFSGKKKK